MSYAKEKFGNLPRILNRNKGTLDQRLIAALTEILPCMQADEYPTPAMFAEYEALMDEATSEPGETGRIHKTIAKMTDAQRESLRDRLLDLARRVSR